jgi:hypothetical protein
LFVKLLVSQFDGRISVAGRGVRLLAESIDLQGQPRLEIGEAANLRKIYRAAVVEG